MPTLLITFYFAYLVSQAAEVALPGSEGEVTQVSERVSRSTPNLKQIAQCLTSVSDAGPLKIGNQTFCAFNWVSPAELPLKLETVYQVFPDRIDVYDIRPLKGKTDAMNWHVFKLKTDRSFQLEVPAGRDEKRMVRFDCPRIPSTETEAVASPARTIRAAKDANAVIQAMRSGVQTMSMTWFIRDWTRAGDKTGANGRAGLEEKLRRMICDCRTAGVVDAETLNKLTTPLAAPPAESSEADRASLRALAESLETCGEPAVS